MEILHWMGNNFFLTTILIGAVTGVIFRIFKCGRIKAMKCPKCGYSKVTVIHEDEDDED